MIDYGIFHPPQTHSSNVHAQPSSGARCLIFGRTLRLLAFFMYTNSKGSGETARMCRLAWAFAGHHVISTIISWAGSSDQLLIMAAPSHQRKCHGVIIFRFSVLGILSSLSYFSSQFAASRCSSNEETAQQSQHRTSYCQVRYAHQTRV